MTKTNVPEHKHGGLSQLSATAICGNDITSSCLYVSALAIFYSGKWAPVALLIVAGVLFLFRSTYSEVVGALPLNGGAYNALLKIKRAGLPRPVTASWSNVLIAITAVLTGLVGNAVLNPYYLTVFFEYFLPTILIVVIMLKRTYILKLCLFMVRSTVLAMTTYLETITGFIRNKIEEINGLQIVFFTRGDNTHNLNQAMRYVQNNEDSSRIKVVIVVNKDNEVPDLLKEDLEFLGKIYPEITIEFVIIKGCFGPELVRELSEKWQIPINFMFIGSPGNHFMYGISELGGVRLVI